MLSHKLSRPYSVCLSLQYNSTDPTSPSSVRPTWAQGYGEYGVTLYSYSYRKSEVLQITIHSAYRFGFILVWSIGTLSLADQMVSPTIPVVHRKLTLRRRRGGRETTSGSRSAARCCASPGAPSPPARQRSGPRSDSPSADCSGCLRNLFSRIPHSKEVRNYIPHINI